MPRYRRGFKTESDEYAREFRQELDLAPEAPLSPWRLADHLDIPVIPLCHLRRWNRQEVEYLLNGGRSEFSAATVFRGTRRKVIYNDGHHPLRQASDVAHELAHGILGHPPTPPLSDHGCRNFDADLEAEANWLGPALLVSREAAMRIAWKNLSLEEASELYQVSKPLVQMRLNVTGATKIVARSRARRR